MLRNGRNWNRELEGGLPDSRLVGTARSNKTITLGRMEFELVFCANCGCGGGAVTAEWSAHVFYICQPCADKLGPPPGLVEANETEVRGIK